MAIKYWKIHPGMGYWLDKLWYIYIIEYSTAVNLLCNILNKIKHYHYIKSEEVNWEIFPVYYAICFKPLSI